jgi:hypothetical protein
VWSHASVESDNVLGEARLLKERGKYVAIRIDGTEPPLGLGEDQVFNLSDWDGNADHKGWKRLQRRLQRAETTTSTWAAPNADVPLRIIGAMKASWRHLVIPALIGLLCASIGLNVIVLYEWMHDNNNFARHVSTAKKAADQLDTDKLAIFDHKIANQVAANISSSYENLRTGVFLGFIPSLVDDGGQKEALEEVARIHVELAGTYLESKRLQDFTINYCGEIGRNAIQRFPAEYAAFVKAAAPNDPTKAAVSALIRQPDSFQEFLNRIWGCDAAIRVVPRNELTRRAELRN